MAYPPKKPEGPYTQYTAPAPGGAFTPKAPGAAPAPAPAPAPAAPGALPSTPGINMPAYQAPAHNTQGGLQQGTSLQDQQKQAEFAAQGQRAQEASARRGGQAWTTGPGGKGSGMLAGSAGGGVGPQSTMGTAFTPKVPGSTAGVDAHGMDRVDGEQYFLDTQDQFKKPWESELYSQGALAKYGNTGTPGVSNRADEAYTSALSNRPGVDADMGKYYENAKRRAAEGIDQQMAARGLYSSSAATDRIGEAFTDLEADRAKAEADYGLRRSADARGWSESLGGLARGADTSSLAASENEKGWLSSLGEEATRADRARLERLAQGQDAAFRSQDAGRSRANDFFDQSFKMGEKMDNLAGGAYDDMMLTDQELLDKMLLMNVGESAEGAVNASNKANRKDANAQANTQTAINLGGAALDAYNKLSDDDE